jgi:uncharacterized protein (DUF1501 family)
MKRRNFIQQSAMGLGVVTNLKLDKMHVSGFQPAQGYAENDNIVVIIQLMGGNDGMNTITPYEWESYYTLYRPTLNIPQKSVFPISKELGMAMHPNLKLGVKNGMLGLFNEGKLSIIHGVGYENPNYSHFRSTDIWLSGVVPGNDTQTLNTGWLGRYFDKYRNFDKPESPYCIQIGQNPSLMFMGETTEKSIVLENAEELFDQAKNVESDRINVGGSTYYQDEFAYINEVGIQVNEYSKVIKTAFDKGKNIENYSNKSLSNQLKLVARLINGGLKSKVYYVEVLGYDTHANQGTIDGVHGRLLAELSEAVSSFQSDIEALGHADKVVGITASEFGRRPYENGSQGTDHGTSSVMFAFGKKVKGEIFGGHFAFLPFRDHQNLRFSTDFRSIYYELMVNWFEQTPEFAQKVLGSKFAYVEQRGFLKTTVPDVTLPPPPVIPPTNADINAPNNPENPKNITEQDVFVVYPNPVENSAGFMNMTLYFPGDVTISQSFVGGQSFGVIHKKSYRAGLHNVFLEFKGGPGLYLLTIKVNNRYHFLKVLKVN